MSAAAAKPNRLVTILSFLVGVFTRNLGAKLAALILALVVWFTVRQDISQKLPVRVQLNTGELALEGLMPVDVYENRVLAVFEGPNSAISKIRAKDFDAELILRVRRADMLGQSRRTLVFSIELGNIEHSFGDEIHLVSIDPETIQIPVAVKASRMVPVRKPTLDAIPSEWELEKIEHPETAEIEGPKDILDDMAELDTKPIPMDREFPGNGEEDVHQQKGALTLTEDLDRKLVRLLRNQRLDYTAYFRRTKVQENIEIPYGVRYESLDSKVRLEIVANTTVKKTRDGTYKIELTFLGSTTDLEKVRQGVKDGTVRAYVRAEDHEDYRNGKAGGGGHVRPVRLEMPDELRRRIQVVQPGRTALEVTVVARPQ